MFRKNESGPKIKQSEVWRMPFCWSVAERLFSPPLLLKQSRFCSGSEMKERRGMSDTCSARLDYSGRYLTRNKNFRHLDVLLCKLLLQEGYLAVAKWSGVNMPPNSHPCCSNNPDSVQGRKWRNDVVCQIHVLPDWIILVGTWQGTKISDIWMFCCANCCYKRVILLVQNDLVLTCRPTAHWRRKTP